MDIKNKLQLHPVSTQQAISQLSQGAQLITAHAMLTAEWKHRYMTAQQSNTCDTPAIFSWSTWITDHHRNTSTLTCLNELQERLLWEQVIHADLAELMPSTVRGLAKHAASAYRFMQNYQINPAELEHFGDEAQALNRWTSQLHAILKTKPFQQRTLAALMPHILCQNMLALDLPKHIIFDGFESFSPIQEQILTQLSNHDVMLSSIKKDAKTNQQSLTVCPDESSELQHMSQSIDGLLLNNRQARIAIITPSTLSKHDVLQRQMNQTLMPELNTTPSPDMQAITMPAQPLSDGPMIQQLLHVLSLAGGKNMSFEDFSIFLFSPWTRGFDEESMQRASLDAVFRRQNRHRLSFKGLLKSTQVQALPALHGMIKTMSEWGTNKRPSQQWIKDIHTLLQHIGFIQTGLAHETARSNSEIRQMNAFRDALTSLIAVDALEHEISWTQCLSLLRDACSNTSLSLPAKYANVVVIPLQSIAGLSFDHVFVLGMDATSFPPVAQPQPLLPIRLQQKHGIPMSHASIVYQSSSWLWHQLELSSPHIHISYALQRDEQEVSASSFVSTLTTQKSVLDDMSCSPELALEDLAEATHTPVRKDESIRGGTSIIRNQSACPFRAFANHRLGIVPLGKTVPGIEASTKGSLIHLALEFIWTQLKSQSALLSLDGTQLNELIDQAVDHAWLNNKSSPDFNSQTIEKKRMHKILIAWLALETTRPAFDVIATEKKYLLQLPEHGTQQFPIKITADRLDKDQEGHGILIDYKTGRKQSAAKWLGQRMEEPQLPIYAMAAGLSEHDAMAFAMVRSGKEMGFEGLSGEDMGIKGLTLCDGKGKHPDDWQEVLEQWKTQINALALEFVDGRNDVAPRNAKACAYCGLEAVCRIEETGFANDLEEQT